jgi:NAD-dependent SIR2 family protein deacetylase
MGRHKTEEIIAIHNQKGEVVCTNCLGNTPWYDAINTEDDMITQDAMDAKEEIIFCDKCKKKL